jgi:hypothetical protein
MKSKETLVRNHHNTQAEPLKTSTINTGLGLLNIGPPPLASTTSTLIA